MIKTSRQLKDLIRNLSKQKQADAQILLRNYMMERFLERVSLSEYQNHFILKGGMLIAALVGLDARSTMDMDATIQGKTVTIEEIENIIGSITSVAIDDGVSFVMKDISDIMDEAEYPGIRISMDTLFDGVRVPLKIDLSTGDQITPRAIAYSFPLMLEKRYISIMAYNIETVIAEKMDTVISRSILNTRMRDFYDLVTLYQMYGKTLDRQTLATAFSNTAHIRHHDPLLPSAGGILNDVAHSVELQKLWTAYQSKFSYAKQVEWNQIIETIRKIAVDMGLQLEKPSLKKHSIATKSKRMER